MTHLGVVRRNGHTVGWKRVARSQQLLAPVCRRRFRDCLEVWDPVDPRRHTTEEGPHQLTQRQRQKLLWTVVALKFRLVLLVLGFEIVGLRLQQLACPA